MKKQLIIPLFIACASAFLLFAEASATTFYVNSQEDLPNANPGNGEPRAANGRVTLRAAIEEANATPGEHTITFAPGLRPQVPGATIAVVDIMEQLFIKDDLRIIPGENYPSVLFFAVGSKPYRVITVSENTRLYMEGVNVEPSSSPQQVILADRGAGMYIHPGAEVTLDTCSFRLGHATVAGGGIYVDHATLRMIGGSARGTSEGDGGGIYNDNGFIHVTSLLGARSGGEPRLAARRGGLLFNKNGFVLIDGLLIINGRASIAGGAIYSEGGSVIVRGARVRSNMSPTGAAMYFTEDTYVELDGVAFRTNEADIAGGGAYLANGFLQASQTTFSGNSAGSSGSALHVASGVATLLNCTLSENVVGENPVLAENDTGGAIHVSNAMSGTEVYVGNTIVADNYAHDGASDSDIVGSISSLGHNLIGIADVVEGLVESDLRGSVNQPLHPMLEFIESIGIVPYYIYEPLPGSPAIDAGDNALLSHPHFVGSVCHDARGVGFPRIRNGTVDIGAIEVQEGEAAPPCGGHSADRADAGRIGLEDLLRVIQFFNSPGYHCDEGTEDGYAPGANPEAQDCVPHSSDYNPQDWTIQLTELLRLVQFFNTGAYHPCPQSEDGFCPGAGG